MQMTLGYWLGKKWYCRAYLIEQLKLEDSIAIFGGSTSARFGELLSMVPKFGHFGK